MVHVLRHVKFDHNIQDKFGPETSPDDFPDLDISDTLEHDEWVKRWRAFTGDGLTDGLTSDADDELRRGGSRQSSQFSRWPARSSW